MFLLSFILLTAIGGCIKKPSQETPPSCTEEQIERGECGSMVIKYDSCTGTYDIKVGENEECVFYTEEQVNGCIVSGVSPYKTNNNTCIIEAGYNRFCFLENFDRANKMCNTTVDLEEANVSVFLERNEAGFSPKVVFDEEVEEGQLDLLEHKYAKDKMVFGIDGSNRTVISMPLMIPWRVEYKTKSGKEVCAKGVVESRHHSKDSASQGYHCL